MSWFLRFRSTANAPVPTLEAKLAALFGPVTVLHGEWIGNPRDGYFRNWTLTSSGRTGGLAAVVLFAEDSWRDATEQPPATTLLSVELRGTRFDLGVWLEHWQSLAASLGSIGYADVTPAEWREAIAVELESAGLARESVAVRREASSHQLSETEVLTTRLLDASRERVFEAWADPSQLTRWWGPSGFTSTFSEHELRTGGAWRFVLHGPDGTDFKNHGVFSEVLAPSRIVFDHQSGPVYRATFDFEAVGEHTRVRWHMRFDNPRFLAEHGALVVNANVQNLDRLEVVLRGPS